MTEQVEHVCEVHPDPNDCPDALVSYVAKFKEYGLIVHDGGSASVAIAFCPWCGSQLPESARDRWFDEVEALGLDPWEDALPPEYEDGRWLES